jgi:predicted enzyme related to lactoylglutathione lyase
MRRAQKLRGEYRMQAVWVEIPAEDVERAAKFYQSVFGLPTGEVADDGTRRTVTFASGEQGAGISLNQTAEFAPGSTGPLVYLSGAADALEQVEAAGGKILQPKTSMGESGSYALVLDSEGNQLALYFAA